MDFAWPFVSIDAKYKVLKDVKKREHCKKKHSRNTFDNQKKKKIRKKKECYLNTSYKIWSKIIGPISGLSSKDIRIRNGFRSCGVSART